MRLALNLLLCAAAVADVATLVTLSDYVEQGAVCLDGTPYEIWYAAASNPANASKWVFDIQGGAWCESISECASRAYDPTNCYLGSSSAACFNADGERCMNKTDAMTFECLPACNGARWCGGLFVNDSATNPLTHDWNKVTYTTYGNQSVPLYFRGHRNFLASIDYLIANANLGLATEVILTGNSAGGLATYYHMDELSELLPHARVVAAPDSGFFFADDAGDPYWASSLLWMVGQFNSLGGLDKSWWGCGIGAFSFHSQFLSHFLVTATAAASQLGLLQGWIPRTVPFPRCDALQGLNPSILAAVHLRTTFQVAAPYLTTPLFVMNSRFDPALDRCHASSCFFGDDLAHSPYCTRSAASRATKTEIT